MCILIIIIFLQHSSVHIKIDEKITLTAGRDGGLQSMEIRGLILLRVADAQFGKIRLNMENNDDKGFQMQVHNAPFKLTEGLEF